MIHLYWILFLTIFFLTLYRLAVDSVRIERKLFATRLHSPWKTVASATGWSLAGGVVASLLTALLGIWIRPDDGLVIWLLALLLGILNIRYFSFVYAIGLYAFLAFLLQKSVPSPDSLSGGILEPFFQANLPALLALAGVLQVVEGLLFLLQRGGGTPVYLRGQRGRPVGAWLVRRFWLLPLIYPLPAGQGWDFGWLPEWWPIFASLPAETSFAVFWLPLAAGFSDLAISQPPRVRSRQAGCWLVLFGILLLLLALAALRWAWVIPLAALFAVGAREGLVHLRSAQEKKRTPYFTHSSRGLSVLAVLPGSPAEEMEVLPGERVIRANGEPVGSVEAFYKALQKNPAFCKLEILNLEGNVRFVQRSLYEGQHYLLGIVFAPEEDDPYLAKENRGLLGLIFREPRLGKKGDS